MRLIRSPGLLALAVLSCVPIAAKAQTLTPTKFDFGNWVVQTTSTPKTVVLKNTQSVALTISSISVSGDFAQTSACPIGTGALAAGASCNISVTFTPSTLGAHAGTLTVSDDAPNTPQTASLSGTGVTAVTLVPSSQAFGSQSLGTTSATKVITLKNNQTVPLTIAGISTSGDFAQTSTCPLSPTTLGARTNCTISITFTPTAVGARSGTLMVSDNAPNAPQTAQLTGIGTAPVSVSPSTLSFAKQVFGTTSAPKTVTLTNTQTVPLTVFGISTAGDFAQTSNCPLSPSKLGAGATCSISVTFTPTGLGNRIGTLSITDSAGGSPQTVSMSGPGTLAGLLSISISPANPTVSIGNQLQFVATGTWSGGLSRNITTVVGWSSLTPAVAPVNATGLAQAITQGATTIIASSGSISGFTTITVVAPTVVSIDVIPGNPSLPVGASQQFTAVVGYSDGSTKNTTNLVSWTSSTTTVASITSAGLANALSVGSTTITATAESVIGSTTLTPVQPPCVAPPAGLVGWWTGDGNTVDIAGANSGTLQNGATYGNGGVGQAFSFAGSGASVLVNSRVYSPTAGTLMLWFLPTAAGVMTGSFDGTNRTPGLAVDANGNLNWEFGDLSSQTLGQVGFNQWSYVALTYSTSNSEVNVNVYLNGSLAASAIASQNSSWYPQLAFGAYLGASKPSFAGLMDEVAIFNQALSAQQVQSIYSAFGGGMCKPTLEQISLTPASPSVAVGLSQQFSAVGSYSDHTVHDMTTSAAWNSSNPAVVTVNRSGQATAVTIGNATITASLGEEAGSASLSVVPGLLSLQVNPPNPSIAAGTSQPLTATGTLSDGSTQDLTASVSWSSSAPSVATITAGGLANGIAAGQATITAIAGSVSSSTTLTVTPATLAAINITPANPAIAAGTTQPFTATGLFGDGSTQDLTTSVSWSSSLPSVATINPSGLATGVASGQTTISAAAAGINGSSNLTVTDATLVSITITPVFPVIPLGTTEQFVATGTFTDGSMQTITDSIQWASSDTSIATISSSPGVQGLATSVANGTCTISATSGTVSGSTTLTVSVAVLVSITVNPPGPSIALGTTQQFTATGIFADGSTQDVTASSSWSSSSTAVATVSSSALGTAIAAGTATITATLGGVSGCTLLTVTPASVVSISVSPANIAIPLGVNQTFIALGTFTDGSTQDVTNSAHWSSSIPGVATVSNTPGSRGLTSTVGSGNTIISATSGSVTGSANLTVTNAVLAAIDISPQSATILIGGSQQFTATGLYTDGSAANITTSVTWVTSSATVATISNTLGSQGLSSSVGQGAVRISAVLGSVVGSTTLTVEDWLASITVAPADNTILLGANQQFTATANYASGLINDVTGSVLWNSSSPSVATINSAGLATAVAIGQTAVNASMGSISGSATLAVAVAPTPTHLRVDISNGTTGQLFVSWDSMNGAKYYNLQRSTSPTSGYSTVAACSGQANLKNTNTTTVMEACRDGSLTVGTLYYYQVQACYSKKCSTYSTPASNVPVASDCTPAEMPSVAGVATLPAISLASNVVDPAVQFLPSNNQFAYYSAPSVPRRNLLLVDLPGSNEVCPGAGVFNNVAEKLGFDVICVNYSNLSEQIVMCQGDPTCFGNVSQAKLDATGVCSTPGQSVCGIDPRTGQPYYLSNPADAITQRIAMMLQYLNTHGYNQNGTNWGNYLSGTTPLWQSIILVGHSQGGVMSTFAAYKHVVARSINLSAPPQATIVNGVEVAATYLASSPATNIRNIYGLVSVYDDLYRRGVYAAVWQVLGFTSANNDAEVKLNTNNPVGLNCNSGIPSHNFSTGAPPGPDGNGHVAPLYLFNEDVYKFMLID